MRLPKHLIVPDPHTVPGLDNDRLDAVGELVLEERPDVVLVTGDAFDFASLREDDEGTLVFEGERYQEDLAWGQDGLRRLMRPVNEYNEKAERLHMTRYRPRWVITLGNHEDRVDRYVNSHPNLKGFMGTDKLGLREMGWEVVPFKESIEIDGIGYSHYFTTGVSGRAISGASIGKTLCEKTHKSSVQGHSHRYDHAEQATRDGTKIFGLSAGCLSHPDYVAGWCRDTRHLWWRGVVILSDLDGRGYYDELRAITLRKLMRDRRA